MHIVSRFQERKERGDTIVEVLIAIAVVSLILGGAYVTTNTSLRSTRDAQERGNALKLVESQIEQLKGIVATSPDSIFGGTAPTLFCISNTGTVVNSTNAACAVDSTGAPTTTEPVYSLSVSRSNNTFTVRNQWNKLGGGQNNVVMVYRLYQ